MKNDFIPWWNINLTQAENQIILKSLKDRRITQGPVTREFELKLAKTFKVPYALVSTNGSIALLMALLACGIKAGDEILIPNNTFIATAQAPLLLGAKVILVDVEPDRPVLDVTEIEKSITAKTKAIIPVHTNGRAVNMRALNFIAQKYNLKIIEDSVQACFSKNPTGYLGTQSDIGIFSLGITKLITAIQGGVLLTKNKVLYQKLIMIRNHGMAQNSAFYSKSNILGFNFNFNDLFASLGLKQLEKINEKIKKHQKLYRFYENELKEVKTCNIINVNIEKGELPLWVEVTSPKRDALIKHLSRHGIQAKPLPPNLCEVPYLKTKKIFKNSQQYSKQGMILPSGSGQKKENLVKVINALKKIV